jgi:hypothetical protein
MDEKAVLVIFLVGFLVFSGFVAVKNNEVESAIIVPTSNKYQLMKDMPASLFVKKKRVNRNRMDYVTANGTRYICYTRNGVAPSWLKSVPEGD